MSGAAFAAATTSWKLRQGVAWWATRASGLVAARLTGAKASDGLYEKRITVWYVVSLS